MPTELLTWYVNAAGQLVRRGHTAITLPGGPSTSALYGDGIYGSATYGDTTPVSGGTGSPTTYGDATFGAGTYGG